MATLLAMTASVVVALAVPSAADHEPGHVRVEPLAGNELNKCQGAMPTPGSENTDKRLVGGNLVPGGTAVFEFTYPFDPTDTSGRQDFVILDCVFAGDDAVLAYELHGVPNDVSPFIFQFTVDIPEDVVVGTEFCNVGKTTAAPSSAQASNRKAGPACFVVGGDLRIEKVDAAGAPLTGATFDVTCTPSSQLLPVVIEGEARTTYTGTTGDDNVITVAGPLGTSCVITETAAPPGYALADPATVTAVIGQDGPTITVVNPRATGNLVITKTTSGGTGTFTFTVDCTPGTGFDQTVTITDSGTQTITGIPTGTVCTVTETETNRFASSVVPEDGTVTIATGDNTVAFTNVRETGNLVVSKTTTGGTGTFTFTVDCNPGTAFDRTVTITDSGSSTVAGIPTGTVCTVTETSATGFSSSVVPADGTVTIATGNNPVAFANVRQTGNLVVSKTTTGGTGTFTFAVDCNPGTAFDQSFTLTDTGSRTFAGIPTGTTCSVTEAADSRFSSAVTPANGTVVIGAGNNTVAFTNTIRPPVLAIAKTADAATVTAGAAIGFTVTVTNTGAGPATAVVLNDPLPASTGLSWAVSPAYAGPGTCSVTGTAPNQVLACSFGNLAPAAGASVHLSSATTAATVGTLTNTATARADNHGPVTATATVTVNAPAAVLGEVIATPAPAAPAAVAPASAAPATLAPAAVAPGSPAPAAPGPVPVAVLGESLPRTGSNTLAMVATAWAFIAVGVVFRRWATAGGPGK